MRQTIIKDAMQKRLQDILGSDRTVEGNPFSIQSSMLENINRICKTLVGDNIHGKVMAGMTIDKTTGEVSIGYGITYGGQVIKFGNIRKGNNFPTPTTTNKVNVYAVYTAIDLEEENGGVEASIIRTGKMVKIINDQVGASDKTTDGNDGSCVRYDTGDNITTKSNEIHVGSIVSNRIIYPNISKPDTLYTYCINQNSLPIWSGTDTMAENTNMTLLPAGGNFVRKATLMMKQRTTSAYPRTGTAASNYKLSAKLVQYGLDVLSWKPVDNTEIIIDDCPSARTYELEFNGLLDRSYPYLGIKFFATTADFAIGDGGATSGYADVNFEIEKLNS